MFGNEKSTKDRQKERERKKRGTRKYGQAKLKHSRMGVYSCFYVLAAVLIVAACILISFLINDK